MACFGFCEATHDLEGEEFAFPLHSVKTTVIHHRDTTSSISPLHLRKQYYKTVQDCSLGGTPQMFIPEGSDPRSSPLSFCIPFLTEKGRYPFRIPSVDKWYPFYIPCLKLCIRLTAVNAVSFKIGISHKNRTFLDFIKRQNSSAIPFGPFHRAKWQVSLPFYILQLVKSLPFHNLKPEKDTSFGRSLKGFNLIYFSLIVGNILNYRRLIWIHSFVLGCSFILNC